MNERRSCYLPGFLKKGGIYKNVKMKRYFKENRPSMNFGRIQEFSMIDETLHYLEISESSSIRTLVISTLAGFGLHDKYRVQRGNLTNKTSELHYNVSISRCNKDELRRCHDLL